MDIRNFFGSNSNRLKIPVLEDSITTKINTGICEKVATKISDALYNDIEKVEPFNDNIEKVEPAIVIEVSQELSVLPVDLADFVNWLPGEAIPYLALVEIFEEISKVSSRIEKENLFAKLFKSVIYTTPNDLDVIIYLGKYIFQTFIYTYIYVIKYMYLYMCLASNEVFPVYEGMELGS